MIILHYLRQNVDYTHEIIDMLLFKGIENLNYLRSLT